MTTYAIGDVQGCYSELKALLNKINFKPNLDHLWFVGDLVNRGPKNLEVLQFIQDLGSHAKLVLGNHDIHLIAVAIGLRELRESDTIGDVLNHSNADSIISWLRGKPVVHYEPETMWVMSHAGLYPRWSLKQSLEYGEEVSKAIRKNTAFASLISNRSASFQDINPECLCEKDLGFILNCFTRMRFLDSETRLNLREKMAPPISALKPWFDHDLSSLSTPGVKILFGHWSTVGLFNKGSVFGLDSGCVHGQQLSAMDLDKKTVYQVEKLP